MPSPSETRCNLFLSDRHLIGIIRCPYGVSGHMTYGFDVSGLASRPGTVQRIAFDGAEGASAAA
jgi:hypothetical protein